MFFSSNKNRKFGYALITWAAFLVLSADAQDAKPDDQNAVNAKGKQIDSMMDDSPVTFPKRGALPSKFPPDVKTDRRIPEEGYSISGSPNRSLKQVNAIQAEMPKGDFTPPPADWQHLSRTKKIL